MRVGKCRFLFFLFLIFCCGSKGATTNSITQFGITWQFSNDCVYGNFANGDYWVVAPVVVTNMTPVWDGTNNGWEINPTYQYGQGFYSGPSFQGVTYTNTARPEMPFTILSNASLVKTITPGLPRSIVKTAAVLTILTNALIDGSNYFRPPYVGTNKPLYLITSLQSNLLPSYSTNGIGNMPTLATVLSNFSLCLRMDHHISVPTWYRPSDAMADYQPDNTITLNEAMLRLMMSDPISDKWAALVQFTQHTIDQAYVIMLGYRRNDDGHNPNHRVLAAWAGVMLNDSTIKTYMATADGFHEDNYLYEGLNGALWGETNTEYLYWNYFMAGTGSRSNKDPYNFIDGGYLDTGPLADYQNVVSQPFKGQALIFKLFPQLQACIPSGRLSTLYRYSARWVTHGIWSLPDPAAPYDGVPANYGITFGPNGGGSYIPGSGRFPARNGLNADTGQYKSLFVSNMWYAYWTFTEMTINGKATFRGKATIR